MDTVEIKVPVRIFKFKEHTLPDPDPQMGPIDVVEFYASAHPELTTGHIQEETTTPEGNLEYTIATTVGTKG
jgi:PRTRC genetic system protein C